MQDTATAAHLAAMACAAHVLGDLFAESTWSTRDVAGYVRDWHKWLTGTHDTVMAYLRRYAMRLASSVGLAPQDVLPFAKAIYEGCGGR
jgi:hypothetical protein